MRRAAPPLLALVLSAAAALAVPAVASAHGLGGLTNLPIPGWMFLVGGATVLVVSFLGLAVLWPEPRLSPPDAGRPMPRAMQRVILSRAPEIALRVVGVVIFVAVWSAAAFGSSRAFLNLAPTFVYVVFWVGLGVTVVLFGDVWASLDPWRTIGDVVAWAGRRLGVRPRAHDVSGRARRPAGSRAAPRVRLARARLRRPRQPEGARRGDPPVQRHDVDGRRRVRSRRVATERRRVRPVLLAPLEARARGHARPREPAGGRVPPPARPADGRRSPAGDRRVPRRDARLGRVRRLQRLERVAGPDARHPGPARERRVGRRGADGRHARCAPRDDRALRARVHRSPSARRGRSPGRPWATRACSSTA